MPAELCTAALALIESSTEKGGRRFGHEIDSGFASLAQLVDTIQRTFVGSVPAYKIDQAMAEVKRIANVATVERSRADGGIQAGKRGIDALSVAPLVADVFEGLIDRECRDVVRAMTAAKRAELLEQIREGHHARVALAAARSPMPSDFDVEAARLYSEACSPTERATYLMQILTGEKRLAAAQALLAAANATRSIIDRIVELDATREAQAAAQTAKQRSSTITHPAPAMQPAKPAIAAQQPSRPMVQVEGSLVSRIN